MSLGVLSGAAACPLLAEPPNRERKTAARATRARAPRTGKGALDGVRSGSEYTAVRYTVPAV